MAGNNWQDWFSPSLTGGLEPTQDGRNHLFAPCSRGYFKLLREWLDDRLNGRQPSLPPAPGVLFSANSKLYQVARLHAKIADKKSENLIRRLAISRRDIKGIADECDVPLGLALDLALEMSPEMSPEKAAPTYTDEGHYLAGDVRQPRPKLAPQNVVTVPVLLVLRQRNERSAILARVLLEWIPGGQGDFYPHPAFAFVERDEAFMAGERAAREFLEKNRCWPKEADIRWRLLLPFRPQNRYMLEGGSAGAALATGLFQLVAKASSDRKGPFPKLGMLDLSRFVVSAAFNADGTLGDVTDHFEKLVGATHRAVPAVHWLVTTPGDQLPRQATPAAPPQQTGPHGLLPSRSFEVKRETARTLGELVEKMAVCQASNWGDFALADLPPVNIPRVGLHEQIETWIRETPAGYLFLWGGMGMGKTTAMLQLVWARKALGQAPIFHFLNMSGSDTPGDVAWSLFLQLCRKYPHQAPEQQVKVDAVSLLDDMLKRISAEVSGHRSSEKEVLFIDAADQVDMEGVAGTRKLGSFISGALRHLPAGVLCIVTSRYAKTAGAKDWFQFSDQMREEEFSGWVNDRDDIRHYLEQRVPDFPAALLNQIFSAQQPPNFFTVNQRLRTLESKLPDEGTRQAQLLRDASLWLVAPEDLVRQELDRIVVLARRAPGPVRLQKVWQVFFRLALAGAALNEPQWKALRFLDVGMRKVLRLSANLFARREEREPLKPYAFDHPGMVRAILYNQSGSPQCDATEIHGELATAGARCWRDEANPARNYALATLPGHLQKAGKLKNLYALAREGAFLTAQTGVADVPNLPLRTLTLALETAANQDDAVLMAEFVLKLGCQVEMARRALPLNEARNGNLERALVMADQHPPERRLLWYLLIFADCHCRQAREDAKHVWTRTRQLPQVMLSDWQGTLVLHCLRFAVHYDAAALPAYAAASFDHGLLHNLAQELVLDGALDSALAIAATITDPDSRSRALAEIAQGVAAAGGDAHQNLERALAIAATITDPCRRSRVLAEVAQGVAAVGGDAHQNLERAMADRKSTV